MLEFTGERFIPTESGEIRYEHMHRYGWAQSLCSGKAVLDIACGEGYGSALLAKVAQSVIGVDISKDAVDHAARNYAGRANLRFVQGSATHIPVDDASVDAVVSFETLEHLSEQEQMLAELRRVLKATGVLVISSPNKKVYSDDRNYANEFHVKELYFAELEQLLRRHFGATRYFGQRFLTASALLPLDGPANRYDAILMRDDQVTAQTHLSDQNMYFVAVCAASEGLLPDLSPNLFVESSNDLYADQQKVMHWASGLDQEHQALSVAYLKLQAESDERSAHALKLNAERVQQASAHDQLQQRLEASTRKIEAAEMNLTEARASAAEARREIDELKNSRSWRWMAPLRWLARRLA
ncbi:class I SAM-dependent methyltransferase [Variovorax fucosicus]|uniref:class I SAM-dependent methyltransferase n=1 Tax=Variovorax fucosicus TaxID=3053517 RepID=UPI00257514F1|nr:class I SAM-dependent methyltransferase [Variovorax sp. J22G47]MDM0055802.1 class I SAM-dependent methyltransferase [Variovorax sp. J22G47]